MDIKRPFFMLNTKSYLYGDKLYELAKCADELQEKYQIPLFFTAPVAELSKISSMTKNIIVTAQHMDYLEVGRGMGYILPESLVSVGVKAVVLNHAENPLTFENLVKTIKRAKELNLLTIVCANSFSEAEEISKLSPEVILCEPTELIGTGKISDQSYILQSNEAVKNVNPNVLVMQGAGIGSAEDISRNLELGADGNGATSGVVAANDPIEVLTAMVKATAQFK